MDILKRANELQDWVVELRRDFHRHPEASMEEVRTSDIIAGELEKLGVKAIRTGKTGVLGVLEGKEPGKVIALRADIDALSVTEETGLPYSSEVPGMMHACGHDSHIAMLLGAAKILSESKDELKGTVKFIFQPGEEILQGAKHMIEHGVMKNPDVDVVFGMHILSDVPSGKVVLQEGPITASADIWYLTIKGKSAHGSAPWQGVDALTCANAIMTGFQTIVSRVNDARSPIVLNIGTLHAGERFNIIPGKAEMTGANRTFDEHSRKSLPLWMEKIIKNSCEAYGCEYEFKYDFGCAPIVNDGDVVNLAKASIGKFVDASNIISMEKMMASDDFGEFSSLEPGVFMSLGGGNKEKNCCYSHHNNHFDIDEDVFPVGIASYAQIVFDYLK